MPLPTDKMLSLNLLGSPKICWGEAALSPLPPKLQALVYFLFSTKQLHKRDALVRMFWGINHAENTRHNLRNALYRLPIEIKRPLYVSREEIGIATTTTSFWLDVTEFEDRVQQLTQADMLDIALCEEAISLYKGDFLAEFGAVTPEFDDWVLAKRARLKLDVLSLLSVLVKHWTSLEQPTKAITLLSRSLEIEPCDELVLSKLLKILAEQGAYAAAFIHYEKFKRELAVRRGSQPSAEIRALIERFPFTTRVGEQITPKPTAFQTNIIGRKHELAELKQLLTQPGCRLVSLVGMGGVGKTRLAQALLEQEAACFSDGAHFVPLQAIESASLIASAIASSLGWELAGEDKPWVQLVRRLRGKNLLFVLDNFEHLQSANEQIEPDVVSDNNISGEGLILQILEAAPQSKIVITSREVIRLKGEWVYPVSGLAYPSYSQELTVDAATAAFPAVALFVTIAQKTDFHFRAADQLTAIAELCACSQGLPLAIELIAGQLRHHGCAELAADLRGGWGGFINLQRDAPARHRSMDALIEWSWKLLDAQLQTVFLRLSIFRESFAEAAALEVAGATREMLYILLDKSLLQRLANGRYQMHELLRQFAEQRIACDTKMLQEAISCYVNYYTNRLHALYIPLLSSGYSEATTEIDRELTNLRSILSSHITLSANVLSAEAILTLGHYYDVRGLYHESQQVMTRLLEFAGPRLDGRVLGAISISIGRVLFKFARFQEAESIFHRALEYAKNFSSIRTEVLGALAVISVVLGRVELAESYAKEALGSYCLEDPEYYASVAYRQHGSLYLYRGMLSRTTLYKARDSLETALKFARSSAIYMVLPYVLSLQADIHQRLGNYTAALLLAQEAVEVCRKTSNQGHLAFSLSYLANAELINGQHNLAEDHYYEAMALATKTDDPARLTAVLIGLGQLEVALENNVHARELFEKALVKAVEIKNPWLHYNALMALARYTCRSGEPALSRKYLQNVFTIVEEQHWPIEFELDAMLVAAKLYARETPTESAYKALHWIAAVTAHGEITPPLKQDADALAQVMKSEIKTTLRFASTAPQSLLSSLAQVRVEVLEYLKQHS